MKHPTPKPARPTSSPKGHAAAASVTTTSVEKPVRHKSAGGRPPKYAEPSRPITVTLPESTLQGLERIHRDRGQAIVKLTSAALRTIPDGQPLVDIVEMAANTGLLVVGPSEALKRIPFLHLVEVAPARFLLALDQGNDFKNLELAIHDVLEDVPAEDVRERELIRQLLEQIKHVRKSERVSMAEILFVKMKDNKRQLVSVQSLMSTAVWWLTMAA